MSTNKAVVTPPLNNTAVVTPPLNNTALPINTPVSTVGNTPLTAASSSISSPNLVQGITPNSDKKYSETIVTLGDKEHHVIVGNADVPMENIKAEICKLNVQKLNKGGRRRTIRNKRKQKKLTHRRKYNSIEMKGGERISRAAISHIVKNPYTHRKPILTNTTHTYKTVVPTSQLHNTFTVSNRPVNRYPIIVNNTGYTPQSAPIMTYVKGNSVNRKLNKMLVPETVVKNVVNNTGYTLQSAPIMTYVKGNSVNRKLNKMLVPETVVKTRVNNNQQYLKNITPMTYVKGNSVKYNSNKMLVPETVVKNVVNNTGYTLQSAPIMTYVKANSKKFTTTPNSTRKAALPNLGKYGLRKKNRTTLH